MKRDVVVIGGGMAGVAAALASARRGARVTLVRRAPGATALGTGGWLGPMPEPLGAHFEAALHPWPVARDPLPSPDGALQRFDRAALAQQSAHFLTRTLVCGIIGLPSFQANVLARMWSELAGTDLLACWIRLERTPSAGWSPVSLAAEIGRDRGELASLLAEQVKNTRAQAVILPAVIGLDPDDSTRAAIEAVVGVPLGESLGSTPSVPGWRVASVLDRMLEQSKVSIVTGSASEPSVLNHRIQSIAVQHGTTALQIEAGAFVLATGKFIGGGIRADGILRENAMSCPVWIEHAGEIFEEVEPLSLTHADRRADQPLLAAGVATDDESRPVDRQGETIFQNLWAAGTVKRGGEAGAYGLGHAAADGWAAGERARA